MESLKTPVRRKSLNLGQWTLVRICIRCILTQRKKPQGRWDFQGQWYWSFKIFSSQKFSAIWQTVFFSCQKACQTNYFSVRTIKICQNQPKGKPHPQEKFHGAATYMKVAMKVFTGLSLCGLHCTTVRCWELMPLSFCIRVFVCCLSSPIPLFLSLTSLLKNKNNTQYLGQNLMSLSL